MTTTKGQRKRGSVVNPAINGKYDHDCLNFSS